MSGHSPPSTEEQNAIALFCQNERQMQKLREVARAQKKEHSELRKARTEQIEALLRGMDRREVCFRTPSGAKLRVHQKKTSYPKRITMDLVKASLDRLTDEELSSTSTVGDVVPLLFKHLQAVRSVQKTKTVVSELSGSARRAAQPVEGDQEARLLELMAEHSRLSGQIASIDRTKRDSIKKLSEQHQDCNRAVMEYMDRTNRSYQPISMAAEEGGGKLGGGGEQVRYNIKKRLISTKPLLNKKDVLRILQRSCAEVLCDECEDEEDTGTKISATGHSLARSAALREKLSTCIMRMIDQEPQIERMVVRLTKTRQKNNSPAAAAAASGSEGESEGEGEDTGE